MNTTRLSVIVWNEFIQERRDPASRAIYPEGLHTVIANALKNAPKSSRSAATMDVTTATQDEPDHGLSEARLMKCDVLIWWGSLAQEEIADEVVDRIHRRVLEGMGLIVLHSGHASKIFRRLLGTSCSLRAKASGEKERLWVVDPWHPIATGLGNAFELPVERIYGESFDIAQPDSTVFISWFAGGDVFRSGCCWERGYGRLFYFRPGDLSCPTFHNENVQRVLANAVQWAAPRFNFSDSHLDVQELEAIDHERPREGHASVVSPSVSCAHAIDEPPFANEVVRGSATANDELLGVLTESQALFPILMSHLKERDNYPKAGRALSSRFKRKLVA